MLSKKIIIDEPFIWNAKMKASNMVIELSKVSNQQIFLIGKDSRKLKNYFREINEGELRAIELVSNISPYTKFNSIDLVFLNLN